MLPKAEEFILDVRSAVRLEQKPTVATDSQLIDPDTTARHCSAQRCGSLRRSRTPTTPHRS